MTPQLIQCLSDIIAAEKQMALLEEHEMNQSQIICLEGFKRFHRFQAQDRNRHAIMLQNFMSEYFHEEPNITLNYMTPRNGLSLGDSIKAMHQKSLEHINNNLKKASKLAFDENENFLGEYIERMICDETEEAARYYRLYNDVIRTNADLNAISCKLHKHFKKKEKVYFGFQDKKGEGRGY